MAANTIAGPITLNTNSGTTSRGMRMWRPLSASSQGAVSVLLRAPAASSFLACAKVSIGLLTGTGYNTTTVPLNLTFSGGTGFAASNGLIQSDYVAHPGFTLNSGQTAVVCVNISDATSNNRVFLYRPDDGGESGLWTGIWNGTNVCDVSDATTLGGVSDENEYMFCVSEIMSDVPGGGGTPQSISGLHHIEEGSPMGKRTNGLLHPIGKGWIGWRKGLVRVTYTTKRAA